MQAATAAPVKTLSIGRLLLWIRAVVLAIVVFMPLFLTNVGQAFFWLLSPFTPALSLRAARFFAGGYWSYIAWMLEKVPKLHIDLHAQPAHFPPGESVILLANHQSYVDPLILICIAKRYGALGDLRFFVKDQLKYVPGPGWGMYFLDCIFLKRNWQQDAARMQVYFDRYKKRPFPTWIHIFPEGTRRTPVKQAASMAYSERIGSKPLHHLLWPRTKGFVATLQGMGSHLDAIYDVTIVYPAGRPPTLWEVFLGDVKHVRAHIDRYPVRDLPQDSEGQHQWLVDLFYHKEALLSSPH